MDFDSQFQMVEPLRNKAVYYKAAVISLKLSITYVKYNITLRYVFVITSSSCQPSMCGATAIGNNNGPADYPYFF